MKTKRNYLALFLAILVMSSAIVVTAAKIGGLLSTSYLAKSKFYRVAAIDQICVDKNLNALQYERLYKNQLVAVVGEVRSNSLSKNNTLLLYGNYDNVITVKTTDAVVPALKTGDTAVVFGKLEEEIIGNNLVLKADKISANPRNTYGEGTTVCFVNGMEKSYDGVRITDEELSFTVPDTWSRLVNSEKSTEEKNDTQVYRFALNALSPVNSQSAEMMYVFHFSYTLHLKNPPVNPTTAIHKSIAKVILEKNILGEEKNKYSLSQGVDEIKLANGKKVLYYKDAAYGSETKEYDLEFIFVPDDNGQGLTCLLYVYYSGADAARHTDEVAYVIDSLTR